jgi:hypothetical protein
MVIKSSVLLSLAGCLLFFVACKKEKNIEYSGKGLIGAYYGNSDLTRIKQAEILSGFDKIYDENTGHGSDWSGKWEGMLIAPMTGIVKIYLSTNKEATLQIGGEPELVINGDPDIGFLRLSMKQDETYPVSLVYKHNSPEQGFLKVLWSWGENEPTIIPVNKVYHTAEQAISWNWLPEPDPADLASKKLLPADASNIVVYSEPGRFCGWPANNGIWSWGDEIVVGFTLGYYLENELHHSIDGSKPSKSVLARSQDGGKTWQMEDPENFAGDGDQPSILREKINFAHPDFALRCNGNQFFYSYDRCKSWRGPYLFPDFGDKNLTSRTDYIVNGEDDCLIFISAKEEQVQARLQDRAFCIRTTDGGLTFEFLSWMSESVTKRSVMPSTARLSEKNLITAMRRRFDQTFNNKPQLPENWIDVYESSDNGKSWKFLSKVANTDRGKHNGNPPSLVKLEDGRICVTYGYRAIPYGIRARLSRDNGKTWGDEILLRDDAREFDLGYTRSVQRSDGKIVTIYYYSTEEIYEQYIGATIWDPDELNYLDH